MIFFFAIYNIIFLTIYYDINIDIFIYQMKKRSNKYNNYLVQSINT
jgi:hypothetical protein